jgi:alpha-galactosidase
LTSEDLEIEGDLKDFDVDFETEDTAPGIRLITVRIRTDRPAVPPRFSIKWNFPSVNVYAFWNPNISVDKANYYRNRLISRASSQAPVISFLDGKDRNRLTFACSDALNLLSLRSYLREEDSRFYCSIQFFGENTPPLKEYTAQIRFDSRDLAFYEVLKCVSDWWAKQDNYTPAPVPDAAKSPMYSTWYSFHQNVTADAVVRECELAKELGFEAVIVDDGWQTLDSQRGYAFTGDWEPERIPDMRSFVDRVHEVGMKFLLWYSLPFIGENSKNYERFKGKYLRYWDGQGTYVLDPRYPEVREFIINTYIDALNEWELDGFKLDFLGRFSSGEDTEMTAEKGRDFSSVNEAVDRLMTDVISRLREVKPDIMIEFRQPYIGPLMRKYGNMFRATDCPNNAVINRVRTTDIRLLCGATAVHSDMFMWHENEPVEAAALQILNILFSVPQLSVRLDRVSEQHRQMIKFWIDYWKDNRNILLDGEFMPENPSALYPVILSRADRKTIAAAYGNVFVSVKGTEFDHLDMVNAKISETVVLDMKEALGRANIQIFDCLGNIVEERSRRLDKGVFKFHVPPSGLLRIKKL